MLKRMGPKQIWVPNLTSNLFCRHKWENSAENRPAACSEHRTGQEQFWFVDSGCSRHMTGEKANFLSLAATHEESVLSGWS